MQLFLILLYILAKIASMSFSDFLHKTAENYTPKANFHCHKCRRNIHAKP